MQLKESGKLPVILPVNTDVDPFYFDCGGLSGKGGVDHVITITDFKPAEKGSPAVVSFDNQWERSDHSKYPVSELYRATMENPEAITVLEKRIFNATKDVNSNKTTSTQENFMDIPKMRMELIRLIQSRRDEENVSQDKRDRQAASMLRLVMEDIKSIHNASAWNKDERTIKTLDLMIDSFPPSLRKELREQRKKIDPFNDNVKK